MNDLTRGGYNATKTDAKEDVGKVDNVDDKAKDYGDEDIRKTDED